LANLDELKARISLIDIASQTVTLRGSGRERTGKCPFHEDTHESLSVSDKLFNCFACGKAGSIFDWLQGIYNIDLPQAIRKAEELANMPTSLRPTPPAPPKAEKPKPVKLLTLPMEIAEKYHNEMPPERREYFRKRGLSDETINRFKLGWDDRRYTIPIVVNGELVNIRRRKDDVNRKDPGVKMLPYKSDYGTAVIFNETAIKDADNVIITEGEFDAMLLCQHGWAAVSGTGGAGTFKPEWVPLFDSCQIVYVCYDNDLPGQSGSSKAAAFFGDRARIVTLPDEVGEHGDLTDFFVKLGKTDADFAELLEEAKPYEPPPPLPKEETKTVHLAQSAHSELVGKKVEVKVLCAGKLDAPYIVPRKVRYSCYANDKDREICGAAADEERGAGSWDKSFDDRDSTFIDLCHKKKTQLGGILKAAAGCQGNCQKFSYQVLEYSNIEEVLAVPMADRVMPAVNGNGHQSDMDESGNEYVARNVYLLDYRSTVNQYYQITGRVYPHPNTQLGTILVTDAGPMQDSISQFTLTDKMRETFNVFQFTGAGKAAFKAHVDSLLEDLTLNVTRIYKRDEALLGILLGYHSVLNFKFEGRPIRRGWLEVLLLGDTGMAKTEMVRSLMEFCGLGMLISGESARRTGICYSVQQVGERWFVKWGKYVLNDRRLLAIDEVSELPEEDLGRMTQGRNDGIMRVEQAGVGEANCRTRLIWMSNPRWGKGLYNFSHGIESLKGLFPTPADLRRLDLAIFLSNKDINLNEINKMRTEPEQQLISAEALKQSILWAWSRRTDDVVIDHQATETIFSESSRLSAVYGAAEDVPLVSPADMRNKLARLCVALAALIHSTDEAHEKVIVSPMHVLFVGKYLDLVYQAKNCRYDIYAGYAAKKSTLDNVEAEEIRIELQNLDVNTKDEDRDKDKRTISQDILALYRRHDILTASELADLLDVHRTTIAKRLRVLQRHGLITKARYGYHKTPKFVEYLSSTE